MYIVIEKPHRTRISFRAVLVTLTQIIFAFVSEWCVPDIVPEGDSLYQIKI